MPLDTQTFELIEDSEGLIKFADLHKDIDWLCFDSEFVGEKRFVTLLCLIQVATVHGIFLIDTLKVKDLTPLLEIIEDERVVKIVHAGENDFRLLNTLFGTVPKNVFDTQMSAGFVGYKYPVSFGRLVESELQVYLNKGYTVTDWESRPFRKKQLKYAVEDVLYLKDLWDSLNYKLQQMGRNTWAQQECKELEKSTYYEQSPYKEAFNSKIIKSLQPRDQLFLVRLYDWRTKEAKRKNYSREMVLPGKLINPIIRAVGSGKDALKSNRRLPEKLISRYGDIFVELYNTPPTEDEKGILLMIPRDNSDNPKQDVINEMLHQLVKYKCLESNISINIVMSRTILKKMKADKKYFSPSMDNGWRRQFLGDELVHWMKHRNNLKIEFGDGRFELKLEE